MTENEKFDFSTTADKVTLTKKLCPCCGQLMSIWDVNYRGICTDCYWHRCPKGVRH